MASLLLEDISITVSEPLEETVVAEVPRSRSRFRLLSRLVETAVSSEVSPTGSVDLLNGAIGISSITFDDDGANVATDVTVTASAATGLAVAVNSITGDLTLGGITVGGGTLGDVAVSDIAMSGTSFVITGK